MVSPDPILLAVVPAVAAAFSTVVALMARPAYCDGVAPATFMQSSRFEAANRADGHAFVGMWATADGQIRHELLAGGRYVEARGGREKAYQGEYTISGNHIDYRDDTGFTADGEFRDGILYHAGMVFYRM